MAFICIILFIGLAIYIKLKRPTWKGRYSEKLVHIKMLQLSDELPDFILAFLFVKDINCRYGFHHTILSCIAVCSNQFEAFYHL